MEIEKTAQEKKVVDILPLGKGKRILVYLCDLVVNFFFAFVLFNIVVYPLAKIAVGFDEKTSQIVSYGDKRDYVLQKNELLYPEDDKISSTYFQSNLEHTFNLYSLFYVTNSTTDYDVFYHYYVFIRGDSATFISTLKKNDNSLSFFDYSGERPVLKDKYKAEFAAAFDSKDSMGSNASSHYETFKNDVFLQTYYNMLNDINEKDLTYNGVSYKQSQKQVSALSQSLDNMIAIAVYISNVVSLSICFLLVPLLNSGHKSISMLFMKVSRLKADSLRPIRKRDVLLYFIYEVALNCALLMLTPLPVVSFSYVFNLGVLFPLSMVSLGFGIISFFFVIFGDYNRGLSDIVTGTVLVGDDTLDEIYRAKGYKV
jgi:hypothetical protein